MAYSLNQRPDKIGVRLDDKYANSLSLRIKELLRCKHVEGFPGSQPVHFESGHLESLEKEHYFVRNKPDGKRYIMFFTAVDGGTAFMMDESCQFRTLAGFKLPLRLNPDQMHNETMMDGEVIIDTDNNKRYLIFDLMVFNGITLIERPYNKRMGILKADVLEPLNAELEKNMGMKTNLPLTLAIKPMELSYGLKFGNDGLIFVPVNHPYESGTCKKLLLWKPITKLTVDFMIKYFKEECELLIFDGRDHKFYDYLTIDSGLAFQWQRNSPDGNIATFWYDKRWKTSRSHDGGWRFLRFVRDKNKADREKDVDRVWKCIQTAVPPEMLENRKSIIRDNWKRRQSFSDAQPLPSPISQIQTPSINNAFESISPSIPSKIYFYNNSNNNTQLVSPSISSSESFAFKERRSSEEQIRDQNIKSEPTESMDAQTLSKFSQMLVTSPGKKSPTDATYFSYNSSDGNHENFKRRTSNDRSYFPPVHESKSPDQTGLSLPNMKPKDSQNSSSKVFEQEMKSLDQRASTRPSIDTTCSTINNSMISPKNRLEKRSADVQYFPSNNEDVPMKDLMERDSPKTSPTPNRDHSLLKSDELIRNDIINHSSNEKASTNESGNESNDKEVVEQASSSDGLNRRERHRTFISSESNGNLNKQDNNYQQIEQEPNFEKEESSTEDDPWDQPEPYESPMSTKSQNNSQDYWAEEEGNENEKKDDARGESGDSIEENNYLTRSISSPKLTKLPIFEQSQLHQDISPRELFTPIPVQDIETLQQQQQSWEKYSVTDSSLENTQPIKQIQPKSPLEQDNRLIPERLQNRLPNNGDIFSSPQLQLPNNNHVTSHKGIPEISFHSNVSSHAILFNDRPEPLQLQNNMLTIMGPQDLIQENTKASYNNIQRTSIQMKSPIPRDQIQEKNISTTSSLQQYKVPDNQSDSTQMHVPNQKTQPIPVHTQLSLQSTNQFTTMETRQLFSQTQDIQQIPSSSTRKVILQNNLQESQQDIILTQPKLSESRQETSRQESRSTIFLQQPRRQTISDSRSIVAPQSAPVQIRTPLQENRSMNPPQTQTQLMDSRSIFQSQVTTQETRQIQQEYQFSNSQYIDKQKDPNMEQERFNHNSPNFQQALKPMPRRHTLSSNPLYHQNFSDSYHHERQSSMMVSSYPPPRQEISSSGISFTSRSMSPPQQNFPTPTTTPQGLNTLSQIPEEHSHNNSTNLKFVNFMHNSSQELSQTTQQIQQSVKNVITNSNIPPVSRPTPQKRKSKGALDFILNAGGGSNLKRSKYDNEDNDAN